MRKVKTLLIIVLIMGILGAVIFLAATGRRTEGEVLVLCGGSMRAAMEDVIARYGSVSSDRILATYGGSGELCAQIQQTRRGDIYVCHDPFMPWAAEQGLIEKWSAVGCLDIVIVVPKGNPKKIAQIEDLARPGVRLGIGDRTYSTSGVIVNNMLKKLAEGDAILKNVRMETKGHQQRCTDVAMGALDAAIVWNAVAHLFRDKLDIIPVPKEYVDAVTSATYKESDLKHVKVTVGLISLAREQEPARRFYEFATTRCRDVFEQYGFGSLKE